MDDEAAGGPVLKLTESGANRKDKPDGELTARVLFDGTHGSSVTHIRGLEKSNARMTTDVAEAHRPTVERDWYLLGCQIQQAKLLGLPLRRK